MTIPFDFNAYSSLLLPAFVQGLAYAMLVLWRYKRDRDTHDLFLALILLLLTVRLSFWMLGFAGWYDSHDAFTVFMFYFPFNTVVFIGPCLYFYFISLTNSTFRFTKELWPHLLLPALVSLLYVGKFIIDFIFYYPFPSNEQAQFGSHGPFAQLDKTELVYLISYCSIGYYVVLVIRSFKNYNEYLLANYSQTRHINLLWLKNLLFFAGASITLMGIFYLAGLFGAQIDYKMNWYPYLFLGIVIYYIAFYGYMKGPLLGKELAFVVDSATDHTFDRPVLETTPQLLKLKEKLDELIAVEKPYLRPDLTLAELAKLCQSNTVLVSKVINEGHQKNFNEYINGLRVDAVIEQLKLGTHQKLKLMSIAYDCGFNSKTTFNRTFKSITGISPQHYISTHLGKTSGSKL
ncbi:MAG: helix-turn-helix domain-containing protein [Bacteroidia bacterium]